MKLAVGVALLAGAAAVGGALFGRASDEAHPESPHARRVRALVGPAGGEPAGGEPAGEPPEATRSVEAR